MAKPVAMIREATAIAHNEEIPLGSLSVEMAAERITLTLEGSIDSRLREQASVAFAAVMQAAKPVRIVGKSAVFADSASWAFLVQLVGACNAAQLPVELDIADEHVHQVLTELGLAHVA